MWLGCLPNSFLPFKRLTTAAESISTIILRKPIVQPKLKPLYTSWVLLNSRQTYFFW
ncbi:uncharacterized protein DS421_5g145000 [Arachis hypogaea]|nr:uncharacterized protein DS421_5g145000 [Arachis hypogaea]